MDTFDIGVVGLVLMLAGLIWITARRVRQRLAARAGGRNPKGRLEALAAGQAELAARLEALAAQGAAPEERLQAMAGQLLGLIRDKNATLETALAGLDQLRARMRTLEQIGAPAEARALVERLGARVDELQAAQAAAQAALEARLEVIAAPGAVAELAERLAQLHAAKDAGLEALVARLGAIEDERAAASAGREAQKRLEARFETLAAEQGAARAELAGLKAGTRGGEALAGELAKLHAQKEALAEAVLQRLATLEAELGARDPAAALAALQARLTALETAETPFAAISEQLTRLYAQKDATVETVFARLAPLEAKLAALETQDPAPALDAVRARLAALETAENPFAEISEQLTRLYAQKDSTVETVFARLAPLEAKLAALETQDPASALDRFGERLEAVQGRLAALETAENPFAEISEQLTRLYAQKDSTVETVFARLAPLEAKLAALETQDPASALDRFGERLEAVQGRLAALETGHPFAEISEQLTRLYAQKDSTVETVFARLAPLEAKLAALETQDPASALDRFGERLEAVQGRLAALETAENPFAEISEQLTRLYAQKDSTVETVFARLAPLEAKLAELEGGMGRIAPLEARLAAADQGEAFAGLATRLEAVAWAQGELAAGLAALKAAGEGGAAPLERLTEQLTRLHAEREAGLEAALDRLTPLEARLAALEVRLADSATSPPPAAPEPNPEPNLEPAAKAEAAPPAPAEPALAADDLAAIWTLPRIVSLHRS